jgi:hypothetical protein
MKSKKQNEEQEAISNEETLEKFILITFNKEGKVNDESG